MSNAERKGSIWERITINDILRTAGRAEPKRGFFTCPVHADHNPSAHLVPGSGERGWKCFACGARGGVADLAVAVGLGHDRGSAARALEERLGRQI